MSTARVRIVVDFDIYDGKLDELETIAKQMVAEIEQEPGTLCFQFLLGADPQALPPHRGLCRPGRHHGALYRGPRRAPAYTRAPASGPPYPHGSLR